MTRVPLLRSSRSGRSTPLVTLVVTVLIAVLAGGLLAARPSYARPDSAASLASPGPPSERAAQRALAVAGSVLAGTASPGVEASLALRDVFAALPALRGSDRTRAEAMLARPTDGGGDPYGDGYSAPARRRCGEHVCVHWVDRTADAPPSSRWVTTNLQVLERVWAFEVGRLGYRRPVPDGVRGGNRKLDVYLKDVGSEGLYGYCAPERYAPRDRDLASGYCVLDDDFARSQFGAPPIDSLRVTAAHEFFHAVQYAYDFAEDRWFMEATATWIEERFADDVNDNRQYLLAGQLGNPRVPLDRYGAGAWQYGNWLFFEYLSQRKGRDAVRRIWAKAGAYGDAPDQYSTQAVASYLRANGPGFPMFYASFAAANTAPSGAYAEGGAYRATPPAGTWTLDLGTPGTGLQTLSADHLTSRTFALRPASGLTGPGWRLQIALELADLTAGPAAVLQVFRVDGRVDRQRIQLSDTGHALVHAPFSADAVERVTVTLVNGSTRFRCWQGTAWSCSGVPRDDDVAHRFSATVVR